MKSTLALLTHVSGQAEPFKGTEHYTASRANGACQHTLLLLVQWAVRFGEGLEIQSHNPTADLISKFCARFSSLSLVYRYNAQSEYRISTLDNLFITNSLQIHAVSSN